MKSFLSGWNFIWRNFPKLLLFTILLWGLGNTFLLFLFRERFDAFYVDIGPYPLIVFDGMIDCETEEDCLHESGHNQCAELDYPCKSPQFKEAVNLFWDWCYAGGLAQDHYDQCVWAMQFPGVYGNPMGKAHDGNGIVLNNDWGGHSELYASIYQRWKMGWHFPHFITRFFEKDWK